MFLPSASVGVPRLRGVLKIGLLDRDPIIYVFVASDASPLPHRPGPMIGLIRNLSMAMSVSGPWQEFEVHPLDVLVPQLDGREAGTLGPHALRQR